MKKIGIFVGSLRDDSYAKKVAEVASKHLEGYETVFVEIGQLELYNQDYDDKKQAPSSYETFRQKVKQLDAFLFITPEYNRSVPAVLKNALDVGSRPYGESVWDKKPAAIISISTGAYGGFGSNHHLRQSLTFLNVPTMQQPEAYLGMIDQCFDENGKMVERTEKFIATIDAAFMTWIETITA